jgi:hypothetical protein
MVINMVMENDMDKGTDMDMDVDMQLGHGNAAWTRRCSMDMGHETET